MAEPTPTRILLADDHPVLRAGLKRLLESEAGFSVVGEAGDGAAAIALARSRPADVLLLDLAMPGGTGLDVLEALATHPSAPRVVLLAASIDAEDARRALQLGARGVLLKTAATDLLFQCIRAVVAGQYWVGRESMADLVRALTPPRPGEREQPFGLTPREREVVALVADGAPNREIAERLGISEQTVKHHLTRIFDKTGQSSRVELALFAQRNHLAR